MKAVRAAPRAACTPQSNTQPIPARVNAGTNTWQQVAGASTSEAWYNIEITVNSLGNYTYYVNGQSVAIQTGTSAKVNINSIADSLSDVSLANYNNGFNNTDTWFQGLSSSTNKNPNAALTVNRLGGSDRYATAVAVAQSEFPNGLAAGTVDNPSTVVLATGLNYADALSGAPLAAKFSGALLLTQTNSLPSEVAAELTALNPQQVIVLGGFGAVAQSVYTQVRAAVPGVKVVQVAGADRYATSLAIAQNYFSVNTTTGVVTANNEGSAFVATGTAFPDALSAAPAAGEGDFPVLLVNGTSSTVPAALTEWLTTNVTQKLYIAGGSGAVSPAVVNQLASNIKGAVKPFSGTDRYDTNFLINGNNLNSATPNGYFWGTGAAGDGSLYGAPTTVYLATGTNYPDALTGGAAAGYQDAPLFLTNGTCVPANVLSAIHSWGSVTTVNVLGGTGAQAASIAALKSC